MSNRGNKYIVVCVYLQLDKKRRKPRVKNVTLKLWRVRKAESWWGTFFFLFFKGKEAEDGRRTETNILEAWHPTRFWRLHSKVMIFVRKLAHSSPRFFSLAWALGRMPAISISLFSLSKYRNPPILANLITKPAVLVTQRILSWEHSLRSLALL